MTTLDDESETPRRERVHCNGCGQDTWHTVLLERKQPGSQPVDERYSLTWLTTWTTLECRGCETVCLRRTYWFSEWNDDELQVQYFPPPISRRTPRWIGDLSEYDRTLLAEVYGVLHAGSLRLAMMGARSLVEIVMQRRVGDTGTFASQLTALEEKKLIGAPQRQVLEAALDVGHAAAHRGHMPTSDDAETVVDIVEHLLQAELLENAAGGLRERTPSRPPRAKSRSHNGESSGEPAT